MHIPPLRVLQAAQPRPGTQFCTQTDPLSVYPVSQAVQVGPVHDVQPVE